MSIEHFKKSWLPDGTNGIALILEPTPKFYHEEGMMTQKMGFSYLFQYLKPHRKLVVQLVIGLFLGTIFQLIFPFLTQSLVDIGIETKDLNFIYIVLVGQIMLFVGQIFTEFVQSWILLHISVRINVNLISDFLIKLMRLPLGFFDSKNTGDSLQRIDDHKRIETFMTQSTLSILLSVLNLIVFSFVLGAYSNTIFAIFAISTVMYVAWITFFLKKRKEVDYQSFQQMSNNQDSLIEIIQGMPEIKLQSSEIKHRWKWTVIQAKLFRTQIASLKISQFQDAGARAITQLKDILITVVAAKAVLDGHLTLGAMLAIQYIIGQLNGPLQQLVGFVRKAQDAHISLERLSEIHEATEEESIDVPRINVIPPGDIHIKDLSFSYTPISSEVLSDVCITCLLYTSPSPRDGLLSRMPSSA